MKKKKPSEKISRHCPFKQTSPTVERTTVFSHHKNSRSFVTKILPTVSNLLFSNLTHIPKAKQTKRCLAHYLTCVWTCVQICNCLQYILKREPSSEYFQRRIQYSPLLITTIYQHISSASKCGIFLRPILASYQISVLMLLPDIHSGPSTRHPF
jgi:hypothetical protein